jgi:tRNA-dihydrouridine synthase
MNTIDGIMIGRAAIGYPWILTKRTFFETGEHLAASQCR